MRVRAVYVLPVVSAAFLVGFASNVLTGQVTLGDTIVQLAIASTSFAAFVFARRQEAERFLFEDFLRHHVDEVRAGTAMYRGQPISYATRLRFYYIVLSFLFISVKLPTRLVVAGSDAGVRVGATLVTLVFGWWGIPWGPVWTIATIGRNAMGPTQVTVGELLEGAASGAALPQGTARRKAS